MSRQRKQPLSRRGASVLVALVLLLSASSIKAQSRVFTTCSAIADGLDSSVISNTSDSVRSFCRAVDDAFLDTFGDEESDSDTLVVDGEETSVEDLSREEGVAVSTSSVGGVPFAVVGGDEEEDLTRAERGVATRPSNVRPVGPWFTIVAIDVRSTASTVWSRLSDLGEFFEIGFHGLGATTSAMRENRARVDLNSGGRVVFEEIERNEDDRYHVSRFAEVSRRVFPGFEFEGSRMYVQVLSDGFFARTTNIELGWGPPNSFDIGGDINIGVRLIEALLLEMLANFEGEFGQICEFSRNVRTVEGDCNSLDDPRRGAAGMPLRRLGGSDPAYPDGDRNVPSGPIDVNVRVLSNALFATSPGALILETQAEELRTSCAATTTSDGTEYEVCPYRDVQRRSQQEENSILPFDSLFFNDHEELVFQFNDGECTVNVLLQCAGDRSLDLADDPCGAETNRFFDRVACVVSPAEDGVLANSAGLTDLFFTFGQFIDHDFGLSPLSQISPDQPGFSRLSRAAEVEDDYPILIPENDYHFFGREEFEFTRARFSEDDPNSQVNLHSSYLDGSQIYGVDFQRARLLRSFEGGKLDLSRGNFPPYNRISGRGALGAVVDNAPNTDGRFFVVGDARGNEQILLLSLHILFLREHNRVADEVAEAFPDYDDELIYQTARAIVIAEYQCIIYNEWLPPLLGLTSPAARDFVYDEDLDASVSAIFTGVAFRFGHSLVGTNLLQMGPGSRENAEMTLIPIRDAFFQPEIVSTYDIDPFIRGGAWHLCKELDTKVVDELRNFLLGDFEIDLVDPPLFDLVSLNLQRGRDMGIPTFNDLRELYGLQRYNSFSEFVSDPNLADQAEKLYGDVDNVDAFFGGLAEQHIPESQLGETFNTIVAEQFTRSRDGDRFFYTGITFDEELIERVPLVQDIIDDSVRLADIIIRNTEITAEELGNKPSVFQV